MTKNMIKNKIDIYEFYKEEYFNAIYDKGSSGHMISRNGNFEVIDIQHGIETYVIPHPEGFIILNEELEDEYLTAWKWLNE